MYKNKGFTLIELVIVIIILGVLSAVAVPRFINMQQDAQKAAIKGIAANFKFVIQQVNYAAILQGVEDQSSVQVTVGNISLNTYFGQPQEIWSNSLAKLMNSNMHYLGNAHNNSSVLNEECSQASMCVIDQARASGTIPGYSQGWGMLFIPRGKSAKDLCFAFYAFSESRSGLAFSDVSTIEDGC